MRKGSEKKEDRYDLFSSLLDANEEENDGTAKLSDDELMGNIFIYLIAGHEVRFVQDDHDKLSTWLRGCGFRLQHTRSLSPSSCWPYTRASKKNSTNIL